MAVKCGLPGEMPQNIEPMLKAEWEAAKKLTHPGVQQVFELAHEEGIGTYLVLESMEGSSLAALLARGIPTLQGLHLLVQLVHILEASERDGFLHGDLRPENLWVNPDGALRVLGFGCHNLQDGLPSIDSELSAFAMTAYQVLTGQLPLENSTHLQDPVSVDEFFHFPPGMPRAMQRVFSKALDRNPENHYATLHGFISVLIAASPLDEEQLESLLAFMDGAPIPIAVAELFPARPIAPKQALSPRDTQPIPIPIPLTARDLGSINFAADEVESRENHPAGCVHIERALSSEADIQEFAIYGHDDSLAATSHPGGSVSGLAPAFYFQLADANPDPAHQSQLRTVTLKSRQRGSIVLFQHGTCSIALLLKPGKNPRYVQQKLLTLPPR